MRSLLRRLHPARRALSRHVQRLRQALDGLSERLREGVALAIGQTVAAAVHEAVQTVLDEPPDHTTAPYYRTASPPARSLWGTRERPSWDDDLDEPLPEDDDDYAPAGQADREASPSVRWPAAVAAGLQAAAWWLRRQAGRCSLVMASGIGLLTALGAYAGGSVAVAGMGLAGAALSLLSLAQTVQASVGLLAVFPTI